MERQEFLKTLGISFAAVCAGSCFSACGKDDGATPTPTPPPPAGTFVTANLSDLGAIGAKAVVSGIAFFRIAPGDTAASFIATQPLCTHLQGVLNWNLDSNLIQCQSHQAQFNASGVNTTGPYGTGRTGNLKTYEISVTDGKVSAKIA